jgi:hypothetical protein
MPITTIERLNQICPDCMDTGIVGGVDIEFRFCLCPSGRNCSTDPDEQEMLSVANSRRTNLLALRES